MLDGILTYISDAISAFFNFFFEVLATVLITLIGFISLFFLYLAKGSYEVVISSGSYVTDYLHGALFTYLPSSWIVPWNFVHGDLYLRYLYYRSALEVLGRFLPFLPRE